ncbi:uncharacterized protein LOC132295103 isoform X2 [Cornus florida]|nr:uncharacterized protein LOC132295103 isoform X2 [Cornus florida]XP_059649176.1 uncharacterized protein LOC132295103 isoform X2 [Cornus florida]
MPSTSQNDDQVQSTPVKTQGSTTSVKRRGPTTNKALENIRMRNKKQPIQVTFKDGQLQPTCVNGKLWIAEVGMQAKRIPPIYPRYDKIPLEEKEIVIGRIKEKFICNDEEYHTKAIANQLTVRLRARRHEMKKHYVNFNNDAIARRNPFEEVSIENLNVLCDRFSSQKFVENNEIGENESFIEFYATSHIKNNETDEEALKKYAEMVKMKDSAIANGEIISREIEEEIVFKVLGQSSNFFLGPGDKYRPTSSTNHATQKDLDETRARAKEAEKTMQEMRQEINELKGNIQQDIQDQVRDKVKDQVSEFMLAFFAQTGRVLPPPQT